jgi:YD repeat-containing protein
MTSPADAAAMIAAITMINELCKDHATAAPKQLLAAALLGKTATDNLLNNSITVTIGKNKLQFIKQPDGAYTPPTGSTQTLSKTGDLVQLTQRHGNTITFNLSQNGRATTITDPFGKTLTLIYNTNDQLTQIKDACDRTLTLHYANNQLTKLTDQNTREINYTHDTNNNLLAATDPETNTTTFTYDTQHRIIQLKDATNQTLAINEYDTESRVTRQLANGDPAKTWLYRFTGLNNTETTPDNKTTAYQHDRRGRPIAITNALGHRATTKYDGHDRPIATQTPAGRIHVNEYDNHHNLIKTTDPQGTQTHRAHDAHHRLISITIPTPNNETRSTSIEYPAGTTTNRPSKTTDPRNNSTTYAY